MREINIQEVGMENFGPYLDPMILQFKNNSMVLMTGPNGIGKTMALDAIPFTLWGVTSKGAKGDDVVNNVVGRNCKTWVKFSSNDNQYLVTRYQKYTKLNNTVILTKNKVDIKKGHQEVLPEINKLICSRRAFMNTLMFGQKVKNFFTDLVDSDKKLIFRELLSLEQYQLFYKETDNRLKKVIEALSEVEKRRGINEGLRIDTDTQIQILLDAKKMFEFEKKNALIELSQSIISNKRLLKEWEVELTSHTEGDLDFESTLLELSTIDSKLNTIQSNLNIELQSIKQQRGTKWLEIQNKAIEAKTQISSSSQIEYDRIQDEQKELIKSTNDLNTTSQERRHKFELKIQSIGNNIIHWQQQAGEIQENIIKAGVVECPLCKQEVSDKTLELLAGKVAEYDNNISEGDKSILSYQEQIKELNTKTIKETDRFNVQQRTLKLERDQIKQIEEDKLKEINIRWNVAIEKIDELKQVQSKRLEVKTQTIKNDLNSERLILLSKKKDQEAIAKKISEIETTIGNIKYDIKQKEFEIQTKEEEKYDKTQLNSYKKRQLDLEADLQRLDIEWEVLQRKQTMFEFWKTGFSSSGIPSMLIDEAIPFMNEKVSYYLDKFTNGRYIVSFDTLASTKAGEFRDKISVNVVDTHTRANSRIQLSGGQTRIIDIATILTLGDLQKNIQDVSINILLFDEIFDSLDEENIGYVSKVLSNMKFGKSIYLISHRHEDQLEADEILTLH
jgi:DNA repair exonuclease SbcCD ATPase subunit